MLKRLNLPSLEQEGICNQAIMMFEILHNFVDVPIDSSVFVYILNQLKDTT